MLQLLAASQTPTEHDYSDLAILLPAYNEASTIGTTIEAFRQHLPGARFWVCDNNSADDTAEMARRHGAVVIHESRQGKGHAVTRLFSEAEGHFFLLADADLTYDPAVAPAMYAACRDSGVAMVTAVRRHQDQTAYRRGHVAGNRCFSVLFSVLFSFEARDIFSGYRIFSRRFVKSFPVRSSGFEIETELSALAATLRLPVGEVDCAYFPRPAGSHSKLRTYRDGARILARLLALFCTYRPLAFFGCFSFAMTAAGLIVGMPVVHEFIITGKILHLPSAVLASGIMVIAFSSFVTGLIMHGIKRISVEQRQLAYLAMSQRERRDA